MAIIQLASSRTVPLARGLIGGETTTIYGQLEVFLTNYKDVKIVLRRKPYSGHSDLTFSIPATDLQGIIKILLEAKDKAEEYWLSRVASKV